MTIDERLERIAERHEILSNTVELLTHNIDTLRDALRAEGKGTGDRISGPAIATEQNSSSWFRRAAQIGFAVFGTDSKQKTYWLSS
ncbi:MAG: hypothetical protein ABSG65_02000 [Bryobacteraceae bacterium]|jgi:hypothetical protein